MELGLISFTGYPGRYKGQIYLVSSLGAYLWKETREISCGMNYFTVASQILSLVLKFLTPGFVVSATFSSRDLW